MFQTSESCIKLHALIVLELLLSEQCPLLQVCVCAHCSRWCVCVCPLLQGVVCVSTAPGVCVCVPLPPGVCVCVHCSRCVCVCHCSSVCVCVPLLQGVCVCVCVSTAPGVCALKWDKYRAHISQLVILCIIVYVTKKKYFFWIRLTKLLFNFFSKPISDYGKMLKYLEKYR